MPTLAYMTTGALIFEMPSLIRLGVSNPETATMAALTAAVSSIPAPAPSSSSLAPHSRSGKIGAGIHSHLSSTAWAKARAETAQVAPAMLAAGTHLTSAWTVPVSIAR